MGSLDLISFGGLVNGSFEIGCSITTGVGSIGGLTESFEDRRRVGDGFKLIKFLTCLDALDNPIDLLDFRRRLDLEGRGVEEFNIIVFESGGSIR